MKKILLIAMGLLISAQALACREVNFNSEWVMFQAAVTDGKEHTGVCDISVEDGIIYEGHCNLSNGFDAPAAGSVVVYKDCSAEIHMEYIGTPITSEFELQLAKNKKSFIGRWVNVFGVVGITNGMKTGR